LGESTGSKILSLRLFTKNTELCQIRNDVYNSSSSQCLNLNRKNESFFIMTSK